MSVLLLAIVIGSFAGLNGVKTGWLGVVAAMIGLLVKSALSMTWVYWWMGAILVATTLAAMASILLKNKALREIITGVQHIKSSTPDNQLFGLNKTDITATLNTTQSKPTQKLVKSWKSYLKLKGVI